MNSDQAKKIQLVEVMAMLGHEVKAVERNSTEYKYLSPFRTETEPSFNVNLDKNAWFDFGLAKGGNTLDFAIEYVGFIGQGGTVSSALAWLERLKGRGGVKIMEKKPISTRQQQNKLELIEVSEVESRIILSYLENERKIDPELIPIYLKQVRYKNLKTDKVFFAYGIKNLSGGYEIRIATDEYSFKSAINGRDISLLLGCSSSHSVVNVFEGTSDFLSLLTMMKTTRLSGDALIMHSLSSYKRALQFIEDKQYKSVNLFLDNNKAGKDHTAAFLRDLGEDKANVQSNLFLPYMDINEALKAQFIPKF
jgi:hypothetical protein